MPAPDNIPFGTSMGNLLLIRELPKRGTKRVIECHCVCGNVCEPLWQNIKQGKTLSCGCYAKEVNTTHGDSRTALYSSWSNMMKRCYSPSRHDYAYYAGRGITVHMPWHNYDKFKAWALSNGYKEGLTIERRDSDGNYEPANCCWAAKTTQAANRRKRITSKAQYLGVGPHGKRWYAKVTVNYVHVFYEIFDSAEEAKNARNAYIKANNLPHTLS